VSSLGPQWCGRRFVRRRQERDSCGAVGRLRLGDRSDRCARRGAGRQAAVALGVHAGPELQSGLVLESLMAIRADAVPARHPSPQGVLRPRR
jgi:hypothetical protein